MSSTDIDVEYISVNKTDIPALMEITVKWWIETAI